MPFWLSKIFSPLPDPTIFLPLIVRVLSSCDVGMIPSPTISHYRKIWLNLYVNLATLLKGGIELTNLFDSASQKTHSAADPFLSFPQNQPVSSILQWTDAIIIFTSIYLERHPNQMQGLLQYMSLIREAAHEHPGFAKRTKRWCRGTRSVTIFGSTPCLCQNPIYLPSRRSPLPTIRPVF